MSHKKRVTINEPQKNEPDCVSPALPAFCFFVFFSFFLLQNTRAAEPSRRLAEASSPDGNVKAVLNVFPAEPKLSDTLTFTLEVQADSTVQVTMPEFGSALGDLQITDIAEKETVPSGGNVNRQLVITATPRRGGKTPIWAMPLLCVPQESSLTIPATEVDIQAAVTPESASLDNIPRDYPLLEDSPPYITYIIAALAVLSAVFLLWRYFRRRQTESALSPETLQQTALLRLAALRESRLYETDVKKFYIELTGLIRWYIEQQTNIRAPELTTEEFLYEIASLGKQRMGLPPELQQRLRLFLESSDLVKFAKFQPTAEEIRQGFHRAEEFITQLTPPDTADVDEISAER